jgi:hypothetical protein
MLLLHTAGWQKANAGRPLNQSAETFISHLSQPAYTPATATRTRRAASIEAL